MKKKVIDGVREWPRNKQTLQQLRRVEFSSSDIRMGIPSCGMEKTAATRNCYDLGGEHAGRDEGVECNLLSAQPSDVMYACK